MKRCIVYLRKIWLKLFAITPHYKQSSYELKKPKLKLESNYFIKIILKKTDLEKQYYKRIEKLY